MAQTKPYTYELSNLLFCVCQYFHLRVPDITAPNRHGYFVLARAVYYLLARSMGYSYPTIGAVINRDHTTVLHSCQHFATHPKALEHLKNPRLHSLLKRVFPDLDACAPVPVDEDVEKKCETFPSYDYFALYGL